MIMITIRIIVRIRTTTTIINGNDNDNYNYNYNDNDMDDQVSKGLADERMLELKLQQPFTPRSRTIELLVTDFRMPRWVLTAPPAQQGFTIATIEWGFNGKPGPRPLVVPAHPSLWLHG